MIDNILSQALIEEHVISIYTDKEDTDRFAAGFIQEVSDQYVLIAHVTPFGLYDGFVLKYHDDIYRVEYQGQYEKKIERLYRLQNQEHKKVRCQSNSYVEDLLDFAYKNELMISLELNNSGCRDIQGKIQAIQDETIVINQIDDYGNFDGETVLSILAISLVTCDTEDEIALRLLYEDNKDCDKKNRATIV